MRRRLIRLAVAAGSGALLSCAFHPLDAGILAWFAVAPLFVLAALDCGRGFALECFVFGFVLFSLGCAWLYQLTPIAGFLVAFLVGLLFFLPFGLVLRAILADRRVSLLVAAPVAWVAFDWVRTWLLSGFPWLYLAHTQWTHTGILRISAFLGAYGLTFAMASVNAALAIGVLHLFRTDGLRFPRLQWVVPISAVVAVAAAALTHPPRPQGEPFRVAVIQGNIPQHLKDESIENPRRGATEVLRLHLRLTSRAVAEARALWGRPPDLVLWAETTLPGWRGWPYPPDVLRVVAQVAGAPAMMGLMIQEDGPEKRTTNSAVLIDADGRIAGRYDKVHPVPGSESIPYREVLPEEFLSWAENFVESYAGFKPVQSPGTSLDPLRVPTPDGEREVGVLICYEVIYPSLAREMSRRGAQVLVNLTNYGWFGESAQLDQALAITVLRAVETGRPVIVCANTGISAVIAPDGRVTARLARDGRVKSVRGWLLAEVTVASDPAATATPYLAVGDVPVIGLAIATALLFSIAMLGRMGILARPPVERDRGRDGS